MEVSEHNRPELEGTSKHVEEEDKRWSLKDEISKLLNASLESCFPDLEEEAEFFRINEDDPAGDYYCENVMTIWHKISKSPELRKDHPHITQQADVGEAIKKNLQKSDNIHMIEGQPSVSDVGIVTFSLSSKWMAERIHKMLQDGIDTWAPKLPVKKVLVGYPCGDDTGRINRLRRSAILNVIFNMLKCSKVDVKMSFPKDIVDSPLDILIRLFWIKKSGTNLMILVDDEVKQPFILPEQDFYKDLSYLRDGFEKEKADWIIFVAPVRDQEYVEMCFTAAKLANWTSTSVPDGTRYAGYETCSAEPHENLAKLLFKLQLGCGAVAKGDAKMLLGYNTAIAVYNFVFRYTLLKTSRVANCRLNLAEMVGEEGDTFVYLLDTLAKIRRITHDHRNVIDELTKASELTVEENKRWGECEERALELHLLDFTEAFKKSCLSLSPHILCDYLYGLSKKFTNYNSSMPEVEPIAKSTLLLCEATAVVMEKCFELLRLKSDSSIKDFPAVLWKEDFLKLFKS